MVRYFMPTNFYFGVNCLKEHGNEIAQLGKKAMIVTGRRSAILSGAQPDVIEVLERNNIEYVVFNEITENPEKATVYKGAELFRQEGCDFLIGIGGGSPIDAAKAISAISYNNLNDREFYNPANIKGAYKIVAIPTTSGTGTEVTPYSVITDTKLNKKAGFGSPLLFPTISYLDPKYTASLPETVTRDTAIDALSHLLEGIYSNKRNKVTYPIIHKGFELIFNSLIPCLEDPNNLQLREDLMLASLYGGIVIAQSSTTVQHSIGYPLTTNYGLSHGMANGIVMQEIMERFYPYVQEEVDDLFAYLKISREDFYAWLQKLELKLDFEISEEYIQEKSKEVMSSRNMALNPIEVTREDVMEIYRNLNK